LAFHHRVRNKSENIFVYQPGNLEMGSRDLTSHEVNCQNIDPCFPCKPQNMSHRGVVDGVVHELVKEGRCCALRLLKAAYLSPDGKDRCHLISLNEISLRAQER
jgi:hypothetical protein